MADIKDLMQHFSEEIEKLQSAFRHVQDQTNERLSQSPVQALMRNQEDLRKECERLRSVFEKLQAEITNQLEALDQGSALVAGKLQNLQKLQKHAEELRKITPAEKAGDKLAAMGRSYVLKQTQDRA